MNAILKQLPGVCMALLIANFAGEVAALVRGDLEAGIYFAIGATVAGLCFIASLGAIV